MQRMRAETWTGPIPCPAMQGRMGALFLQPQWAGWKVKLGGVFFFNIRCFFHWDLSFKLGLEEGIWLCETFDRSGIMSSSSMKKIYYLVSFNFRLFHSFEFWNRWFSLDRKKNLNASWNTLMFISLQYFKSNTSPSLGVSFLISFITLILGGVFCSHYQYHFFSNI